MPKKTKAALTIPPSQESTRLLSPERAALGEPCLAAGGLAEDGGASLADDDGLGVGEDGGDGEATRALDVHEKGAGGRHKSLKPCPCQFLDDVHSSFFILYSSEGARCVP